jgi:hypothetical protein
VQIIISSVNSAANVRVQGQRMAQAAADAGTDLFEWAMDVPVAERGAVTIIAGSVNECSSAYGRITSMSRGPRFRMASWR